MLVASAHAYQHTDFSPLIPAGVKNLRHLLKLRYRQNGATAIQVDLADTVAYERFSLLIPEFEIDRQRLLKRLQRLLHLTAIDVNVADIIQRRGFTGPVLQRTRLCQRRLVSFESVRKL